MAGSFVQVSFSTENLAVAFAKVHLGRELISSQQLSEPQLFARHHFVIRDLVDGEETRIAENICGDRDSFP